MEKLYILLLALAIDLSLGDPPTNWHPVGWMGKVISFLERFAPRKGKKIPFLYGMGIVLMVVALFSVSSYFLLSYLRELSFTGYVILGALLLKSTFSIKGLGSAALGVKRLLIDDKIGEARSRIKALVGRPTLNLDKPLLASATIESVAENTSDSFVGPTFYFLLFGVPGAITYRVVNTFDSMIGYHGSYEYLGKFAARSDDVLNLIPARLTGLLFILSAFILRKDASSAYRTMLSHNSRTESPNAGFPMAAVAGALGVELEKPGHHKLGRGNKPTPDKIDEALSLMWLSSLIWTLLSCAIIGVGHA